MIWPLFISSKAIRSAFFNVYEGVNSRIPGPAWESRDAAEKAARHERLMPLYRIRVIPKVAK